MKDLIERIQLKLQELDNRLYLIKQTLDNSFPNLGENENLSSLVAVLQNDVNTAKSQISAIQSNITAFNNTYSTLVPTVENLSSSISNIDNELYFIVKGTYLTESQISSITNGTY